MAKVLVSLNDALLKQIDRIARSRGLTRSAYLAELAERDAAEEVGPGASPEVHEALRRLDEIFAGTPPGDSTALIRAMRDSR